MSASLAHKDGSEKLTEAVQFIESRTRVDKRAAAVVLGSGLGNFAEKISTHITLDAAEIPNFPRPSVAGHHGKLIFGNIGSSPVILIKGRVHLYEGRTIDDIVFYVRLLNALGVKTLVLTNAAGGVNPSFNAGDLCLITDHLNLMNVRLHVATATGRKIFYDDRLCQLIKQTALKNSIELREGIYAGVLGPSYETRAEVQLLRRLGADAVGMSTVIEATLAQSLGMRVAAISLITNKAAGLADEKLSHEDVQLVAEASKEKFAALMCAVVQAL